MSLLCFGSRWAVLPKHNKHRPLHERGPHTHLFARLARSPRADPRPGFTCDNLFAGLETGADPGGAGRLPRPNSAQS